MEKKIILAMSIVFAIAFAACFSALLMEMILECFDWDKFTSELIGLLSSLFLFTSFAMCEKYRELQD